MLLRNMLLFSYVQLIQEKGTFVLRMSVDGYTGKIFGFIVIY